jgi:hypothetical protein
MVASSLMAARLSSMYPDAYCTTERAAPPMMSPEKNVPRPVACPLENPERSTMSRTSCPFATSLSSSPSASSPSAEKIRRYTMDSCASSNASAITESTVFILDPIGPHSDESCSSGTPFICTCHRPGWMMSVYCSRSNGSSGSVNGCPSSRTICMWMNVEISHRSGAQPKKSRGNWNTGIGISGFGGPSM